MLSLSGLPKSDSGHLLDVDTYIIQCDQNKDKLPADAWLIPFSHKTTTKRLLT